MEPGDELVERRVTSDVFFGNLLAELYDAAPALKEQHGRLSADLPTLEAALQHGASLGKPIILVVDGLDHIARVRSSSSVLSDDETDIVERLATLDVPQGVSLVLGSQPGEHLLPLHGRRGSNIAEHSIPRWRETDMVALAQLHGAGEALKWEES